MATLKESLLASADPVGVFLGDMTHTDPGGRINVTDFYEVLERWCETEGHTLYQMATVRSILVEKGIDKGKTNGKSVWRGIAWSPDAQSIVREVLGYDVASAAPVSDDPPPF